jgi:hypothetical protein
MVIRDPSFADLDSREAPSVPWAKRWYFLNMSTLMLMGQRHGELICHPMPSDQRVLRYSLHGKYAWVCTKPNANGVICLA